MPHASQGGPFPRCCTHDGVTQPKTSGTQVESTCADLQTQHCVVSFTTCCRDVSTHVCARTLLSSPRAAAPS
jgi:hypothetical protein